MISPAILSAAILGITLILFVSERVRHDLVAVIALLASLAAGLVAPRDALSGFADPAVVAVGAVLVVGRALELTGVASWATARLMPANAGFTTRMILLLVAGAVLSAFMNNIAALVVTMPIATQIARSSKREPGAILMPLAFATILGGMTTLIGTPANLIISSVRARELGQPFGFFSMAPVGVLATVLGLTYLGALGWRLLPQRQSTVRATRRPWMTCELTLTVQPPGDDKALNAMLRRAGARWRGLIRDGHWLERSHTTPRPGDRIQLLTRRDPRRLADTLDFAAPSSPHEPGTSVTRVSVAHGSPLIGRGYGAVSFMSNDAVHVVAAGPRAASERRPLAHLSIRAGDQLFIEGDGEALARLTTQMRLLEIDRFDRPKVNGRAALTVTMIFLGAVLAIVVGGVTPALSFLAAAALIAGLRLIPSKEIYGAVDWTIIVMLAAMIPVGASFESSGAAEMVAKWLGEALAGQALSVGIGAMCLVTMLLSIFLNNVATALIMGPLAIRVAGLLGIHPDAMLLAVVIGASSDFLTPIGHQNNLLVMAPGGYRFSDYARLGALMAVIVVVSSATFLAWFYG